MARMQPQPPGVLGRGNVQAGAAGGGAGFSSRLGFPGWLSMLAGLVLCGSFFLPWLAASLVCNDPLCTSDVLKTLHFPSGSASSPTGFRIATGMFAPTTGGPSGQPIHESFTFVLLWLVVLVGLLLIVLPLLMAMGKVDAGRTRISLLVLCLLALGVEVIYGVSAAQALPQTRAGVAALLNGLAVSAGRQAAFTISTGPAIGFWVALGATLAATALSGYALYTSATGKRVNVSHFWVNVGLAGQVALVAALALVVVFFLPWFSSSDPTSSPGTAWNEAADGIPMSFIASGSCAVCQTPQVGVFPYLWLIPLAALALLAIVWLLSRGLLWRRMAAMLICATLLVTLVLEVLYLLEVQSLHTYAAQIMQATGQQMTGSAYSVAWGFWAALAVTGITLLLSSFLLMGRHKSVTGRLVP